MGTVNGVCPGLLSRSEACRFLGVGEDKLRELICDRSIKPVSLPNGKQLLFRLMDLEKFVAGLEEVDSSVRVRERQKMTSAARVAQRVKEKQERLETAVNHGVGD